jgi:hypothetical protein
VTAKKVFKSWNQSTSGSVSGNWRWFTASTGNRRKTRSDGDKTLLRRRRSVQISKSVCSKHVLKGCFNVSLSVYRVGPKQALALLSNNGTAHLLNCHWLQRAPQKRHHNSYCHISQLVYNKNFCFNEHKCIFEHFRKVKMQLNVIEKLFCLPFQCCPLWAAVLIAKRCTVPLRGLKKVPGSTTLAYFLHPLLTKIRSFNNIDTRCQC